jgi:hypothetical protein
MSIGYCWLAFFAEVAPNHSIANVTQESIVIPLVAQLISSLVA